MSPSDANGSSVATIASWYALMIQTDAAGDACRSAAIAGSAVFAIAVSSVASATASSTADIARQLTAGSCAPAEANSDKMRLG